VSFYVKSLQPSELYNQRHAQMIANDHSNSNSEFSATFPNHDFDVAKFIRFLKQIRLKEMLSKINDSRQQSKITYKNHSLLLWALSVFFLDKAQKMLLIQL
jgi:hypothetical protein